MADTNRRTRPEDGKDLFLPSRPAESVDSGQQPINTNQLQTAYDPEIQPLQSSVIESKNQNANSPEELLKRFYAKREPEPTFNQDKSDRLQRMGRLNQAGRGINVIGDALGVALGANVKRRQPDTTSSALYQAYQDNLDKYKAEKDAWTQRDYRKDLQDIQLGLSRADLEEQRAFMKQKQADWNKAKEADNKLKWAQWSAKYDLDKGRADETARHNKEMEKAAMIRANKTGQKSTKGEKPYMIAGIDGEEIEIKEGKFRNLLNEAQSNKEFFNTDFKASISKLDNFPDQQEKHIVQRYLEFQNKKEKARQEAEKVQPIVNRFTTGGQLNDVVKNAVNTPIKQDNKPVFNPEKAKKFKNVPQGGF